MNEKEVQEHMEKRETAKEISELLCDPEAFPDSPPKLFWYPESVDADELSYEQWVHPLRMTGGKIALKWEALSYSSWGYIWWDPRGLVYTFETAGHKYEGPDAVNCMKETMRMMREGEETITVVLKEDIDA